ncbi:MAG: hypothetical protein HQ534_02180 [Armatimonadetes bacterium]|nr:hypothetical protein [Armatimonadota bacterium]
MEKSESKVTKTVRDGVIKAYNLGEDIVHAVGSITKEIIKTSKDEELTTKEKVQTLAKEALEGAKQGAKVVHSESKEFAPKAGKAIFEAIKFSAPKVAHFAKEAFTGIYEGAKDVYETKKGEIKEKEE